MSRFVIPLLRAGLVSDLLKSFQRGPLAQHKYLKREPYFVGGKLRWRYWYASDELRKQGMAEHDPAAEHEHHLLANIADIYEHFKAIIRSTAATPTTAIEGIFQRAVDDPKAQTVPQVSTTPAFQAQHVQPFIDEEAKGQPPEASPLVRVHDALEMVPDYILKIVMEGTKNTKHPGYKNLGPYPGLKSIVMTRQEDEGADYANTAGWAHPKTGELHLLGGGFGKHGSNASYSFLDGGDPATAPTPTDFNDAKVHLEKVVWHELAHHLHFALETEQTAVMDSWRALSSGAGPKPTAYAHTAWWEDFAESFSGCFALPKVMAMRCPERYEWMQQNVLKTLPTLDAILKMSDEELAWWNKRKNTPPGKLLVHLKSAAPARRFGSYYSDKDQFFTVGKGGRTVYIRFGPSEPEQEDSWTQVPSTIDPETGLPVYDAAYGPRFKVQGNLKEMYDEKGNPLDDFQAFLYLGQDDPEVQEFVQKTVEKYGATLPQGSPAPTEYDAMQWLAQQPEAESKALETRLLSYKMYTSLGYKRESEKISAKDAHTTEKERKRVQKERAKGGTGYLDRHEWVPVEIPRSEFIQKSGTFKFDNMRPAEYQPWQAREWDPVTKTSRVKTVYDPASGKTVPVRTSTVYEQTNPDGTTFRLTVAEGEPFSIGQTIRAPVSVRLPDGRVGQEWQSYKLSAEDGEMTVTNLAKKFRIDPETLLRQNNRFMRGQITDHMLAAMINPSGEVIRDQFDLMRLMKLAAEQPKPPTTWVSVRGKTGSIAHFKVSFDGAGPPRVEGRQWAAKLGIDPTDPIRLDQILGKDDELIGVETVRERKPKSIKIKPGALVWVTVKNHLGDAKRVMARYIEKKSFDEKGKKKSAHTVQVLPGQGAGLPKDRVLVTRVNTTDESQIPGKPDIRRRFVEPMAKDVLLYADEVRVGSSDRDTSGVIKILAPKNGSVTKAQLAAIPGVRILGLEAARHKGGAVTEELPEGVELAISPRDLPSFREYIGGFAMDERVSSMMDEQADLIRERALQTTGEDWPPANQIVDDDGNVHPDGVLRGMVTGAMGMQPGAHRIEALQRVAQNNGRLIAAHFMGTGKTAFSIAAAQMMRNLEARDQPGKPHPNQLKKKVLALVPLNTANNYADEVEVFTGRPATIIGSSSLAGSVRMFHMPKNQGQRKNESREAFIARSLVAWKEAVKVDSSLWNPWADDAQTCVCPYEYFRDNEELMRATDLFDGLVVDEAHNIARENELSRAVERWNPSMNMFLMLTGTPVTNTLDVLPRMASLVSAGRVNLGTKKEFTDRYLVGSAVAKGEGAKNPPKTDLNPQRAGELAAIMHPLMHIATTQDVKGKTMPAVLLDENKPAHMVGQQARMYRLAMAKFTPEERASIIESGAVGTDESFALGDEARRKIGVARSIANCLAYKAPDQRENLTYESKTTEEKKGKVIEKTVTRIFALPTHTTMTTKRPEGWGGKWPTFAEVEKGIVEAGYYNVLSEYYERLFGVSYDSVAGKAIPRDLLEGVKRGDYTTPSGAPWGTVVNPDYGPEGMIARGVLDPATGKIEPHRKEIIENGQKRVIEVKPGLRFIRDPNSKASGFFYHEDDWNFTGRFIDSGEGGSGGTDGGEDDPSEPKPVSAGKQAPKDASLSIQRSTKRRKEREQFDLMATQGNAKSDELEQYMVNALRDDNLGPDQQFILFGNRIGSSFRAMESKMRTMGYQDVNEALGHPEWSTAEDKAMMPRKFFVTYAGKGATLGDRDINSEMFRQKLDQFGHKTGQSMFVFRTLNGGTKKAPPVGEMREGWSRGQRKRIADALAEPTRKTADGKPAGLEVPMRVTSVEVDGRIEQRYLYESDMKPKDRAEFARLEKERRGADKARKKAIDGEMRALADRYWSARIPLSDHYQYVFNNTQIMIATDAANVGLNWPAPKLVMYDSLFSPMDEWQRMTRAARMLDAAITGPAKKYINKIDEKLSEMEKQTGLKEYGPESSLQAVQDVIEALDESERSELLNLEGGSPEQIVEAIFSRRAMEKIAKVRPEVSAHLRQAGMTPDPDLPTGPGNYIRPTAIQESDITNEIVRKHLTPFEQRILRARMYLVDVKRLTTSCDVPEFQSIKVEDPMTGKKTVVQVPTGKWTVESPTSAERSILTQGRMKMVPYEKAMKTFQSAQPVKTDYDFLVTPRASIRSFSIMPEEIEREKAQRAKRAAAATKPKPAAKPAKTTKKSEGHTRFFIPARLSRGEA